MKETKIEEYLGTDIFYEDKGKRFYAIVYIAGLKSFVWASTLEDIKFSIRFHSLASMMSRIDRDILHLFSKPLNFIVGEKEYVRQE